MSEDTTHQDSRHGDEHDESPKAKSNGMSISRRTALKGIPAALGLGGLYAFTGRSKAWEESANNRIQKHRTTTIDVAVLDSSGNAVSNADVDVAMIEHDYGFGSAINAEYFQDSTTEGDNYRQYARDLFNKGQMENRNKWAPWIGDWGEDDKQEAIDTIQWMLERDIEVHGHANIWQHMSFSLPDHMVNELEKENPDDGFLKNESRDRQANFTSYWANTTGFTEFAVQNEPTHETNVTDEIRDTNSTRFRPPESINWFEEAHAQDGPADLYANDYNVINQGGNDNYKVFLNWLIDNEAPLDAIGMQGHHWGSNPQQDASEILAVLDEFHGLAGHPIQILEYDTADMNNMSAAGDYLYKFLKVVYSHHATVGFQMWGFYSGRHWKDQAPLFETDWTKKPAYYRYIDLLFNQWWTNTSGTTDSSGTFSTDGFLGRYHITAEADGERGTAIVNPTDPKHTENITVQMGSNGVIATDVIQAEDYDDASGVDGSGGTVSSADDGDWVKYSNIDFGNGVGHFEALLASGNQGNDIEIRLDGTSGEKIGTMTVEETGDNSTFSRQGVNVTDVSDIHDLYLRFVGGSDVAVLDRFRFVHHAIPNDETAPPAPTNLTVVSHTDDTVTLDWDPSEDTETHIDQYNIYRDGVKVDEAILESEQTVTGLSPSTSYDFTVTAVDLANNESSASNTVSVTTNEDNTSSPTIDQFDVQNNSNPNQAKFGVDWAVSDDDSDLDSVRLELRHDGRVHASASHDVSGSSASGSDDLLSDDSHHGTYYIDLIVRDSERNKTTQTKEVVSQ